MCLVARLKEAQRTQNYLRTKCNLNCLQMLIVMKINCLAPLLSTCFLAWAMLQWVQNLISLYLNLTYLTKKLKWEVASSPKAINRPDTLKLAKRKIKKCKTTTRGIVTKAIILRCSIVSLSKLMSKMNWCRLSHLVTTLDNLSLIIFTTQAITYNKFLRTYHQSTRPRLSSTNQTLKRKALSAKIWYKRVKLWKNQIIDTNH